MLEGHVKKFNQKTQKKISMTIMTQFNCYHSIKCQINFWLVTDALNFLYDFLVLVFEICAPVHFSCNDFLGFLRFTFINTESSSILTGSVWN